MYQLEQGFITTFIQSGGQTSASGLFVTCFFKALVKDFLSINKDISAHSEVFITDSVLASGSKEASLPFQQERADVPAVYLLLLSVLPQSSSSANTSWEKHGQQPPEGFHLKRNEYEINNIKCILMMEGTRHLILIMYPEFI